MILRRFVIFSLCIHFGLTTIPAIDNKEPTISECAAKGGECDETKGRPVCGTDDQTYPSRCHLIRVQCSGHQVSLKHRGPCKECIDVRSYALKHRSLQTVVRFIPKCRLDGSYAAVQCLEDHGCWCSDRSGKPIPNTTTRNGKPNCRKYAKTNVRRSPTRILTAQRNQRICTQTDQAQFNSNLLNVFQSEYKRYHTLRAPLNPPTTFTDKNVLEWKFSSLDLNQNHMLDKNEYRELKRLVKKVIKPKRCARAFGKFCDVDDDERLSLPEWTNCLARDGLNRGESTLNQKIHHGTDMQTSIHHILNEDDDDDDDDISGQNLGDFEDSDDYETEDGFDDDQHGFDSFGLSSPNQYSSATKSPIFLLRPKDTEPVARESEGESDCLADRAQALEEQNTGGGMYFPECTADGRYQRVQCYRSTGYCWCVHEDTGKNIPGTSVKDKRPQCDSIYPISRPMKGCPEPKKTEFMRDLKLFLKTEVASRANSGANSTYFNTEDEKIATLSFVFLDKNKNSVWERKEWKTFREIVTASKPLRKCGKKMPRYCDVNGDKKITLSEWLNCLETQRITNDTPKPLINMDEAKPTKQSKLNGPNPLESYLKE